MNIIGRTQIISKNIDLIENSFIIQIILERIYLRLIKKIILNISNKFAYKSKGQ